VLPSEMDVMRPTPLAERAARSRTDSQLVLIELWQQKQLLLLQRTVHLMWSWYLWLGLRWAE